MKNKEENFKPGINRVLIMPAPPENKMGLQGRILVSEWRQTIPNYGLVVSTGELRGDYTPYELGEKVTWHKQHNGAFFEMNGKLYLVLHIENVLGKHIEENISYNPETTSVAI